MDNKRVSFIVPFEKIPYEIKNVERVLTGFRDLDFFNKGIEIGITEIVGDTNTGKSILTSGLIDSAIKQGYKVGVFAGEHSLSKYKAIIMRQNAKSGEFVMLPFRDVNGEDTNIVDWFVNKTCQDRVAKKYNGNLYLFDVRRDARDVDTIVNFVTDCNVQYGARFFVIDNMMEIENNESNQFQEQTSIMSKLRNVAIKRKLFICLVMHTSKGGQTDGFRHSVRDAFGSSNITNKAYNVWFIYRRDVIENFDQSPKVLTRFKADCAKCGYDYYACDAFIEIAKTKGNKNGIVGLHFDSERQIFTQAEKMTETEADKIYKKYDRESHAQQSIYDIDDSQIVEVDEDFEMPF